MRAKISIIGNTNIIMVLNMKRFIVAEDQARFETIRGLPEFGDVLRKQWLSAVKDNPLFISMADDKKRRKLEDTMSAEQVGFATGVFRSLYLEEYAVPGYVLQKEHALFSDDLRGNFQFRNLFLPAWKGWQIYIRPTITGMLLIRLTKEYNKPREIIKIAEDVINVQESLDIQSALAWLERKRRELQDKSNEYKKIERSVNEFLRWMGSSPEESGELLYNPVQWKIAMEVAARFITVVKSIPIPGFMPIQLTVPTPRLSIPLHDSYAIFHIDEIFADESIVVKSSSQKTNTQRTLEDGSKKQDKQIPVLPDDLYRSPLIKRALLNLIEGAILESKHVTEQNRSKGHSFPVLRWQTIDALLEKNLASWMEEICLLTSRTALIIPARKYRRDYLLVSTTPGATLRVRYRRYWDAIERMIEFTIEIRTLAQLVERASYRSLEKITKALHEVRATLQSGDIELDHKLPELVNEANNVQRLAAMTQGMSDPLVWSRTEFALTKAIYLLDQLGVPLLLTHIDRNINSLNSETNHIDELYALDLAEKSNDLSVIMTLGLAAASFILTLIMLPSFWVDTQQIDTNNKVLSELFSHTLLRIIGYLGTGLGVALIFFASTLLYFSAKRWKQVQEIFKRSINRLGR